MGDRIEGTITTSADATGDPTIGTGEEAATAGGVDDSERSTSFMVAGLTMAMAAERGRFT